MAEADSTKPPIVTYADIYKENTIYVGERKIDGESQAEFTYGDGTYVINFAYRKSNPDAMKGAKKAAKKSQFSDRRGVTTVTQRPSNK
jgi:hypothetical protein